jgi:ATPase subunit of ABC transporter with duplicated ATPase domains
LGYAGLDFERDIRTLSGGERTRAGLARALSIASDVLILDEPTNHLDINAREWLDDHLRSRQTATVLTSHDRTLLAAFATRVIEIERGKLRLFEGGFAEYRRSRAILDRQAWDAYHAFERRRPAVELAVERRRQLATRVAATPEGGDGVRNPFYARKAAKVARTGRILRERVGGQAHVVKPWEEQPIDDLSFEGVVRSGDIVLSVQDGSMAYGGKILVPQCQFRSPAGRPAGDPRAERLGQDDAAEHYFGTTTTRFGQDWIWGQGSTGERQSSACGFGSGPVTTRNVRHQRKRAHPARMPQSSAGPD